MISARTVVAIVAVLMALFARAPLAVSQTSIEPPETPKSTDDLPSQQIVSAYGEQFRPALAYSPVARRYLVVWEDQPTGSLGDAHIRGALVDVRGIVQGSVFDIAAQPGSRRHSPRVAYNANTDEFLVVYEYEYAATDRDVMARRVQSNGTLVGIEIGVARSTSSETKPAVAHNTAENAYLVVWELWVGDLEFGHSDIYAQRLTPLGAGIGGAIAVKAAPYSQVTPAAAYFGALNQYSVMWVDRQVTLYPRIYEQRFESNGVKIGPEYNSTAFGANYKPNMVYNRVDDEYAFVFENKAYGPPDVMLAYFFLNSLAHGWGLGMPVTWNTTLDQLEPDITFNARGRSYALVWEQAYTTMDHDIYVELIEKSGQNSCCVRLGPSPVTTRASWAGNPAIATSDGPTSLVVWEDASNSGKGLDVFAAVISHGKALLPLVRRAPH